MGYGSASLDTGRSLEADSHSVLILLGETEMRKFAVAAALVVMTGSAVNAQTKSTPQAVAPAKVAPAAQAAAPAKVTPAAQAAVAPSKVVPAAQAAPSVPAKSTPQG